jgi:hypothetical protein
MTITMAIAHTYTPDPYFPADAPSWEAADCVCLECDPDQEHKIGYCSICDSVYERAEGHTHD